MLFDVRAYQDGIIHLRPMSYATAIAVEDRQDHESVARVLVECVVDDIGHPLFSSADDALAGIPAHMVEGILSYLVEWPADDSPLSAPSPMPSGGEYP